MNEIKKPRPPALAALAALLVAALSTTALADDGADLDNAGSDPSIAIEEEVYVEESLPYLPTSNTIVTKLPVELEWTPAHVGVVTSHQIREQGARVLGDALENVSGLNVQTGNGVFDFFVMRGFDSLTSGLILTDGAPEPETTFYQLYNAERVEVFKGPAGFLYGSNPLAGVVNLVRKQPVPADFGVVGLAAGSHETLEGTLDVNRSSRDGELSFRLNGLWRESDGYRDNVGHEAAAVNPAFTWQPSEGTRLNVNVELVSSDYRPDAGLPVVGGEPAPVPRSRDYASPFDESRQDVARVQVDFEAALSDRLTLRNKTYFRGLDWETRGTLISGVFPNRAGGLAVARSLLALDDRQRFVGNQFEALITAETGSVSHRLLAGVEIGRFADDFTLGVALLPAIDLLQPRETAAEPLFFLPDQAAAGDSRSVVVAPYLVDQIEISDRLQATVGLRFDRIDFEDDVTGASRSESEASPLLGVVYRPAAGLSLYANAARSFSPPSPRVFGERRPEESRQLELGLRKEHLKGRLRTTFAVYQLERENIAIPDDNGFTQQAGDQRSRGFEVELAAELARGLRATFAYAYTDSELTRFTERVLVSFFPPAFATIDRSGNRSAFAPEHVANLWVSKRIGGGFSVAGGARYLDEQFIAEDNSTAIDGFLLLDTALTYLMGDWRFTLNLRNLADEEYETRGFGSFSVIPGEPRSLLVGVEYRL